MDHTPVLLQEVLAVLPILPTGKYIDVTLGDGGHARAILERSQPNGQLLGLDQDSAQIAIAKQTLAQFGPRAILTCSRFSHLADTAQAHKVAAVDGILFDLGYSSRQLSTERYGLTFDDASPLDMRLSGEARDSAADLLNHANETELADTLYFYGDRHNSRAMARKLMAYRRKHRFTTARDVKEALMLWQPAQLAPIFQALRIWVNNEYEELASGLPQAVELLKPDGVLAIITFHSGEDRIVKQFFQRTPHLRPNKQIIRPSLPEIHQNPRARSAKLRVATKC